MGRVYSWWTNNSGIDVLEFAKKMEDSGAGELLVTSMDRDGTQVGFDIELTSKISSKSLLVYEPSTGLIFRSLASFIKFSNVLSILNSNRYSL